MKHRTISTAGLALVAALLVGAPGSASADEPTVRSNGDELVYTDPALADADTTTVRGVLREVVAEPEHDEHGDHDVAEENRSLVLMTDEGDVLPVAAELGDADVADAPVVARLVDGAALDAARSGRSTSPVPVARARFDTAQAAGVEPGAHRVWVVVVDNSGPGIADDATLEARVQSGLDYWTTESGATFSRVATAHVTSSLPEGAARCGLRDDASNALWDEAAAQFPDVTFGPDGRHLVVLVSDTCPGGGSGIGTLGGGPGSGGALTMRQGASGFTHTFGHEMGHNLGLDHANLGDREYYDLYSLMGASTGAAAPSLDTEYRDQLGLSVAGEVQRVTAASGLVRTLAPRGASSGLRGIELRRQGFSYWVEWRSGTGRDAKTHFTRPYTYVGGVQYPPGVTISRMARGELPNGVRRTSSLLPRTAGKEVFGSWQPGQTFTASGVTVKVGQVTGSGATVTVSNIAPLTAGTPKVSGTPRVGRRLSVSRGTWTSGTAFTYRWLANGRSIKGATRSTFVVPRSLKGKRVSVQVTGRRSGYTTVTRTSARTGTVR